MPRRSKQGKFPLRIETLSGHEIAKQVEYDDFTGEVIKPSDPIAQIDPDNPPKGVSSADLREAYRRKYGVQGTAKQGADDHVRAEFVIDPQARSIKLLRNSPKVELIPAGKRKIGELGGMAVLIDKGWRRI